jgi:hypothetical protein
MQNKGKNFKNQNPQKYKKGEEKEEKEGKEGKPKSIPVPKAPDVNPWVCLLCLRGSQLY